MFTVMFTVSWVNIFLCSASEVMFWSLHILKYENHHSSHAIKFRFVLCLFCKLIFLKCIFYLEGNNRVYSGAPTQLSYTVPGLQYYTQYTFRVGACTERGCAVSQPSQAWTLPASPEQQPAPSLRALANDQGAHAGVGTSWDPPAKPNGNITSYELFRRDVISGNILGHLFG